MIESGISGSVQIRQKELLDIIKGIDEIFKSEGITYSLCGGTLIGAVREKGFIPWDDDMDIMLDRENFKKACEVLSKPDCVYALRREIWVERIHYRSSADPDDAAIDIMVMDNCPDNPILCKCKVLMIKMLQGMMKTEKTTKEISFLQKTCLSITRIIGKPFSMEKKYKWYQKISQIGNKKPTRYKTGYNDLYHLLNIKYPGNLMDEMIMSPFEDAMLPITAEYDRYLTLQYGDYMTPPPAEKRKPVHV